jgi:organic hydroperoxide reductase OsmC/OhrA
MGTEDCVDPEEAFVASLSACHMLTFLALCTKERLVVESYEDDAVGLLEKNADGNMAITSLTLRPNIVFSVGDPSQETLDKLHHDAHGMCFIASSVKSEITVESV